MRKLLIITAVYTGHGHKSISDALTERLNTFEDLEIMTIDGFDLMTKFEKMCYEKTYGPITRLPGRAWELNYVLGMKLKQPVQYAIARMIEKKFIALLREYHPDCILSVHPVFIGSILDILKERRLNIPFIAHQADLIDIALQWFDKRCTLTLAPSEEAYQACLEHGLEAARVKRVGFPVRSRFMGHATGEILLHQDEPLTVSLMSGSEGSGLISVVANELLHRTDVKLNIICGRNKRLRKKLKEKLSHLYHDRVKVLGFVEHIEELMQQSDILVMRASPNSVMEGVALNKPIILFGQLAGQELHNPDMLQSHGLAIYCPEPHNLVGCIEKLKKNGGEAIDRMIACQRAYASGDVAMETAKYLNEIIQPIQYSVY